MTSKTSAASRGRDYGAIDFEIIAPPLIAAHDRAPAVPVQDAEYVEWLLSGGKPISSFDAMAWGPTEPAGLGR